MSAALRVATLAGESTFGGGPMSYEIKIGKTLDERFKITDLIGKGGMASVYEAIDCSSGGIVAIKVPHLRYESDPGFYSRFEREEEIGGFLRHPSILRIQPVKEKSRPYLVMERLEGSLLSRRLAELGRLPIPEAVEISARLADALRHMHVHGVIHRDLKPKNIMLCEDGSLRIIDLGLAKGKEFRHITIVGLSAEMGSPDYMSPEQVKGRGGDERSDIYSLGAILYRMVTGSVPFEDPNPFMRMKARLVGDPAAPRTQNPDVSPELEEIILHAMARDPGDRYPAISEMRDELRAPEKVVLAGRAGRLRPPTPWGVRWQVIQIYVWSILGTLAVTGLLYAVSRLSEAGRG